jgi:hypothetical protein
LNDAANDSQAEDSATDIKEELGVKKEEKVEKEDTKDGDDDDVIMLPAEEPVITEIADENEQATAESNTDGPEMQNTIIDDDLMIQEPKIETQIVNDDDDDSGPTCTSSDVNTLPFIVKIKEEPKDDGYEDHGEEDPFIEVTSINEDLMLGKLNTLRVWVKTLFC